MGNLHNCSRSSGNQFRQKRKLTQRSVHVMLEPHLLTAKFIASMMHGGRVVVVVVVLVVLRGVSRVVDRVVRCVVRSVDISLGFAVELERPSTGITQLEVVGITVVVGSSKTTLPFTTLNTVILPLTVVILWVLFWKFILLSLLFSITLLESELLESVLVTLCELVFELVFILLLVTLLSSEEKRNVN